MTQAFIVGVGGTAKPASSTELALALALRGAEDAGAETALFDGAFLAALPLYGTRAIAGDDPANAFLSAVRRADGLIIASPGYHGSVSGMVKNALDFLEETARDPRPYLDGMPVGLIVTAHGWQATGSTLAALRSIVHALRGWPSPLGATINSADRPFDGTRCKEPRIEEQLRTVGLQVSRFARTHRLDHAVGATH